MSDICSGNGPTVVEAKINADIDDNRDPFHPDEFRGQKFMVRFDDTGGATYLEIDYRTPLGQGTHTLTHTQYGIKYKSTFGGDFEHPVGGTITVIVLGNTQKGTLTGVRVSGRSDTAPNMELTLTGTYTMVVN
ncbi:hypothetical protein [Pseudomonas gessardii]|uniref:Uncharacterized protein n=1 Tax=Pseudomonas gessardii TaxID=78544 RepID=A0A7Y1MQA8_9PSED|nr:hypothetical protein [Pseudomonas gessardii]NNA96402.1 hypothetical protein [Pseudomonas gessardii]